MKKNRPHRRFTRRSFLGLAGGSLTTLLLAPSSALGRVTQTSSMATGYGELVPDPGGVLDLPSGFQYRIISAEGGTLSDGRPIPGDFDGMAAFTGPGNTIQLVRNHELRGTESNTSYVVGKNPYDSQAAGGTTGILVGPDRKTVKEFVTSAGSRNNCAGGPTPWGTWITCEEDRTTDHGYVFEVMPDDPENELSRTPIRDMGFFSHEAIAVDPLTGIVYLTEDDFRGEIPEDPNLEDDQSRASFLYRYIPEDRSQRPGALQKGGTLQVLTLQERPAYNIDLAAPNDRFGVVWVDVDPEEPHDDARNKGGARFTRLEGVSFASGALWFSDTAGGEARLGQIFRYLPETETLELFFEGTDINHMESPDNLTVTPWGDLWFVEDGDGENRLMGITPDGSVYKFASNRLNDSELCGPCFSPDGKTFFVNIQNPGITFAIWGPFARRSAARQRTLAIAAPPAHLAPAMSGELVEAAAKYGLSPLEAAAYQRLGVALL